MNQAEHDALLRAVCANPGDDDRRLVDRHLHAAAHSHRIDRLEVDARVERRHPMLDHHRAGPADRMVHVVHHAQRPHVVVDDHVELLVPQQRADQARPSDHHHRLGLLGVAGVDLERQVGARQHGEGQVLQTQRGQVGGLDIGGQAIGSPTAFHVGVQVNPGAEDLESEIRRFAYKVEAGAEFAVTKPVFDVGMFERFFRRIESARLPIILGLWPFESVLNAEFMANEVPGVRVPDAVLDRMRRVASPEAAADEGVAIAREVGCALKGLVQGTHVAAPSGRIDAALAVLAAVQTTV